MLNMACTLFKLTPEEALHGVTTAAAKALGLQNDIGILAPGKKADFAIWDINYPAELSYYAGGHPCYASIKEGQKVSI
jgi:imidazolonepropionase